MTPGVIVAGGEIHVAATGSVALENIFAQPAILKDGSFVIVYRGSDREVYQRHYNADGTPKDEVSLVTTAPGASASEPEILVLRNGNYMVSWKQSGVSGSEIEAQVYDMNGVAQGNVLTPTRNSTNLNNVDSIQLANGNILLSWTEYNLGDGFLARGQFLRPNGSKKGGEFALDSHVTYQQADTNAVALPDGGFALIWEEYSGTTANGSDLKVQKYDATGTSAGPVRTIDLGLTSSVTDPEATALADGGFVVTWWGGFGVDGDNWGVFAQIYNKAGKPVGGEIQLNTTTASQQWAPDIKGLPDGGFVAVWQSFDQDDSGEAIVGQRFDARGEKIGDEFIVNTSTAASQWYAGIDVARDGGFVVSWQSHHLGGNQWQVMAQQYEAQQFGTAGKDVLRDKAGADHIYGLDGNDRMFGLGGNDKMFGGAGNDRLDGARGDDRLFGDQGADILIGGKGKDSLVGGKGKDVLKGGGGNDTLKGGGDADSFDFSGTKVEGRDKIADFQNGTDVLTIHGSSFAGTTVVGQGSKDTLVTLEGGTEILLKGISVNKITADDFDFL